MGQPPAYLFIVRHGSRLDVADRKWTLTSPTAYNPPLTYGGWLQAKALGTRIASILRHVEADRDVAEPADLQGVAGPPSTAGIHGQRQPRRFKVVIHSSPFLRCIQTSTAISAGLAQSPMNLASHSNSAASAGVLPSPIMKPTVPEYSTSGLGASHYEASSGSSPKAVLRLDAFLGEWLSPEYFEMITPPPGSATMLANAKADLLRRDSYNTYLGQEYLSPTTTRQLWTGGGRAGQIPDDAGLDGLSTLARSLPEFLPGETDYVAPTPHYAVSMSSRIPEGYVTHARDACMAIDYQWDSSQAPLNWGDGGTFGEEWTAMHRRFRKGAQCLVDWYLTAANPADIIPRVSDEADTSMSGSPDVDECEAEADVETVVVLVSHGAGCNALIGAITHQPALMDVGMASLTMAVRKPMEPTTNATRDNGEAEQNESSTAVSIKAGTPMHQLYDVPIIANTDHLRSAGPTPATSRPSTGSNIWNTGSRGRVSTANSNSPVRSSFHHPDALGGLLGRSNSSNASLGSMRRGSNTGYQVRDLPGLSTGGITVGSGVTSFSASTLSRSTSFGLWTPTPPAGKSGRDDDGDEDDDYFPDFDHKKKFAPRANRRPSANASSLQPISDASVDEQQRPQSNLRDISRDVREASTLQLGHGTGGLWGSPRTGDMTTARSRG